MFKVIPFSANINQQQGAGHAAEQLESVIVEMSGKGFVYVRMETIPTFVAGNSGCMGIGATPATTRSYPVLVFRRS